MVKHYVENVIRKNILIIYYLIYCLLMMISNNSLALFAEKNWKAKCRNAYANQR